MRGIFSDSSGAVIPGAEIKVVNLDTGANYTTSINESGTCTIPFIKPGNFELNVESPSFKQYKRAGIRLETAAAARADVFWNSVR